MLGTRAEDSNDPTAICHWVAMYAKGPQGPFFVSHGSYNAPRSGVGWDAWENRLREQLLRILLENLLLPRFFHFFCRYSFPPKSDTPHEFGLHIRDTYSVTLVRV